MFWILYILSFGCFHQGRGLVQTNLDCFLFSLPLAFFYYKKPAADWQTITAMSRVDSVSDTHILCCVCLRWCGCISILFIHLVTIVRKAYYPRGDIENLFYSTLLCNDNNDNTTGTTANNNGIMIICAHVVGQDSCSTWGKTQDTLLTKLKLDIEQQIPRVPTKDGGKKPLTNNLPITLSPPTHVGKV